ncbi:MAG: FAD-dependent oxidoreductase, partial [Candidatus Puniceispirillum sp.]
MNEQGTARPQTVIIGASHAGVAAAEQLRGAGYVGGIVILDRLAGQPLERPPLSKAFLQNTDQDDAKFRLRCYEWFAAQDVTLIDGHA